MDEVAAKRFDARMKQAFYHFERGIVGCRNIHDELSGLQKNYERGRVRLAEMSAQWMENGPGCCPMCGIDGYKQLLAKQRRRLERIRIVEQKIAADKERELRKCSPVLKR